MLKIVVNVLQMYLYAMTDGEGRRTFFDGLNEHRVGSLDGEAITLLITLNNDLSPLLRRLLFCTI